MHSLAGLVADNADDLPSIESRDNGKLLREMSGQMAALLDWFGYFAGAADKIEGRVIPSPKANYLTYTRHEPIGVVGATLS